MWKYKYISIFTGFSFLAMSGSLQLIRRHRIIDKKRCAINGKIIESMADRRGFAAPTAVY